MHLPSIIVMTLLVNAVVAVCLLILYKKRPSNHCFGFWSLSCCTFVVGGVLSLFRLTDASPIIGFVIADIVLVSTPILVFAGLLQFSRIPYKAYLRSAALGLVIFVTPLLFVTRHDPQLNGVLSGVVISIVFLQCAYLLMRVKWQEPYYSHVLSFTFLLHAVTMGLHCYLLANQTPLVQSAGLTGASVLTFISHVALTTLTALILPWLSFLKLERKLLSKSQRDGLTRLNNREHFFKSMERVWGDKKQEPISLMMIDIDHFKSVNDKYGHLAGDIALKKTANTLARALRQNDIIGRVGGEEFIAVLPATSLADAKTVAERVRKAVEKNNIDIDTDTRFSVSISIGLVHSLSMSLSMHDALKEADKALYKSKEDGRNKITTTSIEVPAGVIQGDLVNSLSNANS